MGELFSNNCSHLEDMSFTKSILVVEDDPDLLEFANHFLTTLGYHVTLASSAEEAIQCLEESSHLDLIFSDVRLPGNMDGTAIARRAKQLRPSIKVLITTGFDSDYMSKNGRDEFQIIQKPYFINDLKKAIQTLLNTP